MIAGMGLVGSVWESTSGNRMTHAQENPAILGYTAAAAVRRSVGGS